MNRWEWACIAVFSALLVAAGWGLATTYTTEGDLLAGPSAFQKDDFLVSDVRSPAGTRCVTITSSGPGEKAVAVSCHWERP